MKYEATKSDKVKSIVAYRAKKRMFKALKVFAHRHLIAKNYFPENAKILLIHTGGLQGIQGMNLKLKNKGLPILHTHD